MIRHCIKCDISEKGGEVYVLIPHTRQGEVTKDIILIRLRKISVYSYITCYSDPCFFVEYFKMFSNYVYICIHIVFKPQII